jgi:hypothetical protein
MDGDRLQYNNRSETEPRPNQQARLALGLFSGRDRAADLRLLRCQSIGVEIMGTQGQKHTDAHGAIKRAGAAAKSTEKVAHQGTSGHLPHDPSLYKAPKHSGDRKGGK